MQLGAFRESGNARELITRLERSGEQPFTVAMKGLTLVNVGPYETETRAAAAKKRLERAGFEGYIFKVAATTR